MERPQDDQIDIELDKLTEMFHLDDQGYVIEAIHYVTNKVDYEWGADFAVSLIQAILTKYETLIREM